MKITLKPNRSEPNIVKIIKGPNCAGRNTFILLKAEHSEPNPHDTDLTLSYICYIRADELGVLLNCNSQLDALLETNSRMLFIDATGNISSSKGKSRQFYYSAQCPIFVKIWPKVKILKFHSIKKNCTTN